MAEVKIGVNADGTNVARAIDQVTAAINKMGAAVAAASRLKFEPVDVKYTERDLSRINTQFGQALKQSAALRNAVKNSGQEGRSFAQMDWSRTSIDPAAAQKNRDRAFRHSTAGTAWDMTNFDAEDAGPGARGPGGRADTGTYWGRNRTRDRGEGSVGGRIGSVVGTAASSFAGGLGGGVGRIANGAIGGASAGAAEGGGLLGGMGGMVKGGLVAAAAAGALKAGQMVMEGYGMAKDRDIGLDTVKRQMGDNGISFDELKSGSDTASQGLGVNAKEFASLEQSQLAASHGAYRHAQDLAGDTATSVGFARSFGTDPSQTGSFFGGMKNVRDPRQNNKELAVFIAEAIQRVGGRAMASDVMQAVLANATQTSRNSLSSANSDAFAGAYTGMLINGGPGMNSDAAGAILGQANSAMMQGGMAGEAGQNFMLQALNKTGPMMNPVEAKALEAGGLFGSRTTAFGTGTPLAKYMESDGHGGEDKEGSAEMHRLAGTSEEGAATNFDAFKAKLESDEKDKWLRLDAAQRMMGLSSPQQAAALLNLDGKGYGSLKENLGNAGISLNNLNATGIQTEAEISGANTKGELGKVYGDIRARTGVGSLSDDEKKQLDAAQGGDPADFKKLLTQIMAGKDQQETEGSDIRKGNATLENIQISIGEKLVPAMNQARDALLSLAGKNGKSATPEELARAASDAVDGVNQGLSSDDDGTALGAFKHYYNQLETGRSDADKGIAPQGKERVAAFDTLADLDKQFKIPAGGLEGIWGTESSFGANSGRNSAGAEGNFQQLDGTVKRYGVKRGDFNSEATGAARQIADLMKANGGDFDKALKDYGGFVTKDPTSYINKVHGYGDMDSKKGFIPEMNVADNSSSTVPKELQDSQSSAEARGVDEYWKAKTPKERHATAEALGYTPRKGGTPGGTIDTVVLDVNINATTSGSNGTAVLHNIKKSVSVPRGSGTTTSSVQSM
jgi:hypothetical protein